SWYPLRESLTETRSAETLSYFLAGYGSGWCSQWLGSEVLVIFELAQATQAQKQPGNGHPRPDPDHQSLELHWQARSPASWDPAETQFWRQLLADNIPSAHQGKLPDALLAEPAEAKSVLDQAGQKSVDTASQPLSGEEPRLDASHQSDDEVNRLRRDNARLE